MKTIWISTLALVALSSVALAGEQVRLADAQMDRITAGAGGCGDGECFVGSVGRARAGTGYGLHDVGTFCDGDECYSYSVSSGTSFNNGAGSGIGGRWVFGDYTCTGGAGYGVGGGGSGGPC